MNVARGRVRPSTGFACLLPLLGAASAGAAGPAAEPFRTRNLSPVIGVIGLPAWETAPEPGRRELGLTIDLANHFWFQQSGIDAIESDFETQRASLRYRHAFTGAWSVGVELPGQRVAGGALDRAIDAWHDLFNLPDGARGERPAGEVLLRVARDGAESFEFDRASGGPGDARVSVARSIGQERQWLLRAEAKLSTGRESILAGSGSTDATLTLTHRHEGVFVARPAAWYWGVGVIRTGQAVLLPQPRRSGIVAGTIGGGWALRERIGIKAQFDLHSAVYDTDLAHGRTGVQLTIGGWWQFAPRALFDFGVNEDLTVNTSPDLLLHTQLRWSF
jgi:hypothetical protein